MASFIVPKSTTSNTEKCILSAGGKANDSFRVPEHLVNIGDLSSYKQSGVSHPDQDSYGPDGWMR